MTKCSSYGYGGGIQLRTGKYTNVPIDVVFSHLVLSHNRASNGGGLSADLKSKVSIAILNSKFFYGVATGTVGGALIQALMTETYITIKDTNFVENSIISKKTSFIDNKPNESELFVDCGNGKEFVQITVSLLDSTILHTGAPSNQVVRIVNCANVNVLNTKLRMANQKFAGFVVNYFAVLRIINCQFEGCYNLPSVFLLQSRQNSFEITNSSFSNNTGGRSVITLHNVFLVVKNSNISDNSMTGITAIDSHIEFRRHNVIQNNHYTEGAGIVLSSSTTISVASGQLHMINNTADNHGGAILVTPVPDITLLLKNTHFVKCSMKFLHKNSLIVFSGNRAGKGGDDTYGAKLMNCKYNNKFTIVKQYFIPYVGQLNQTSRYFDTPLMKHFHFSNTDRLSSMSSDPIMVCFCNNSNLPDCSDRTPRHIQTYPGLEINTTIATVGYYGGTSPGVVQVSAQHAKLLHFYGQMRPPTVSSSTFSCRTHPQQQHWLISRWKVA